MNNALDQFYNQAISNGLDHKTSLRFAQEQMHGLVDTVFSKWSDSKNEDIQNRNTPKTILGFCQERTSG